MRLPGGSTGRLLAAGVLLALVAAVLQLAVAPALRLHAAQAERLAVAREQRDRFQQLSAQLPAMRTAVARLREQDLLAPFLVSAPNGALAAAELQERLKATALAHEGRILSTRVLPGVPDGPFERVVVDARLEIPLEGLQDLLHEIETRKPYLFVDELSVMARPQRRGGAAGTTAMLETRLTLYGLRRRAETTGAAGG